MGKRRPPTAYQSMGRRSRAHITHEMLLDELWALFEDCRLDGDHKNGLEALRLLGQEECDMFIKRTDVTHRKGISLQAGSAEEVMAQLLGMIRKAYPGASPNELRKALEKALPGAAARVIELHPVPDPPPTTDGDAEAG